MRACALQDVCRVGGVRLDDTGLHKRTISRYKSVMPRFEIIWTPDHPKIAELLTRLADGETLTDICKESDMPSRAQWYLLIEAHDDLARRYARARVIQGDAEFDAIGELALKVTSETANADRVKLESRKWRAERLNPRYNPKLDLEHSGNVGVVDVVQALLKLTPEQITDFVNKSPEAARAALPLLEKAAEAEKS